MIYPPILILREVYLFYWCFVVEELKTIEGNNQSLVEESETTADIENESLRAQPKKVSKTVCTLQRSYCNSIRNWNFHGTKLCSYKN